MSYYIFTKQQGGEVVGVVLVKGFTTTTNSIVQHHQHHHAGRKNNNNNNNNNKTIQQGQRKIPRTHDRYYAVRKRTYYEQEEEEDTMMTTSTDIEDDMVIVNEIQDSRTTTRAQQKEEKQPAPTRSRRSSYTTTTTTTTVLKKKNNRPPPPPLAEVENSGSSSSAYKMDVLADFISSTTIGTTKVDEERITELYGVADDDDDDDDDDEKTITSNNDNLVTTGSKEVIGSVQQQHAVSSSGVGVGVGSTTLGSASLIAGTTVGAGILALPTATMNVGFIPSTIGMIIAYIFMTISGLYIAELTINRINGTGRSGLGLLELYDSLLPGKTFSIIGSIAYFFLHYAMMVAYIAQGGTNFNHFISFIQQQIITTTTTTIIPTETILVPTTLLPLSSFLDGVFSMDSGSAAAASLGQITFAMLCGFSLYVADQSVVEKINNIMVLGVITSFIGIMATGIGTANIHALFDPIYQNPAHVINCFPILFLALVYQNVVPTVVNQLDGDRNKVTNAIVTGTTIPLFMFLAWNAVILGNVLGNDTMDPATIVDPVAVLQNGNNNGGDGDGGFTTTTTTTTSLLGPLVSVFSSLALITSIIGFTYGLIDAWTDIFNINMNDNNDNNDSSEYERYKIPLFALVFIPPLALSIFEPNIFYKALEYGGAFGVSTLFLVLPPIMIWIQRYRVTTDVNDNNNNNNNDDNTVVVGGTPILIKPMVPYGKIPVISMLIAAIALILQQMNEKIFDLVV